MSESAERARAKRRSNWPVRIRTLHDREVPSPPAGTAESRLRAVAELTATCWRLSGKPFPDYARHETPVRVTTLSGKELNRS